MSSHQIDISEFEKDPRLFLFTSLTAGSSHIITATSRMETILKANKIPFQAIDLATDEKARRLWQRRAREKKLPGLVKEGFVLGDLEEVEEWNEFGELKENIGDVPASGSSAGNHTVKSGVNIAPPIPVNPTATQGTANVSQPPPIVNKAPQPGLDESKYRALPGAAEIAARNKPTPEQQEGKSVVDDENAPPKAAESMTSAPAEKEESINAAKKLLGAQQQTSGSGVDHLSAPASALQSGTATPDPEPAETLGDAPPEETLTHRGSEVKDVPTDEIKKVESETALAEATEEDVGPEPETKESQVATATATATSAVNASDVGESEESATADGQAEGEVKTKHDAAATVEASDAGEGKAAEEVEAQSAKEPDDAGKTVGD